MEAQPPNAPLNVFRPHILFQTRLAFVGCGAAGLFGVYIAVTEPIEWALGLSLASFFGLCSTLWFFLPHEIVFADAITLRRRLLNDKRIEYGDITSIGLGRFTSHKGSFRWSELKNGLEFSRILNELIESGVISEHQLDDRVNIEESAQLYAAIAWSVITGTLGLLLWIGLIPASWIAGYPGWVIELATPLAILGIAYLFFRFVWFGARLRREKQRPLS